MSEDSEDLAGIRGILRAARMDAVCDQWHLDDRAVPSLRALAGELDEPRLRRAASVTAKAGEHFVAAQDALRDALDLIEELAPED
jgi:hypothetical protein